MMRRPLSIGGVSSGMVFENQEADMMTKCKTMAQEMKDILIRLRELDQRTFRSIDPTSVKMAFG